MTEQTNQQEEKNDELKAVCMIQTKEEGTIFMGCITPEHWLESVQLEHSEHHPYREEYIITDIRWGKREFNLDQYMASSKEGYYLKQVDNMWFALDKEAKGLLSKIIQQSE